MGTARVNPAVLKTFPAVSDLSKDLEKIGNKYRSLELLPVVRGNSDVRSLSWRCAAIANANLLRAEELFYFGIIAINKGALIAAHLATRALDETLAALIFSRRRILAANEGGDEKDLAEALDRLTCGNRYMSRERPEYPRPYKIGTMIQAAGTHLREVAGEDKGDPAEAFQRDYGVLSEVVHPSHGSFSIYQRFEDGKFVFGRCVAERMDSIPWLLSSLRMSAALILIEAEKLRGMKDLPPDWPSGA
jgi:hypothetical protein